MKFQIFFSQYEKRFHKYFVHFFRNLGDCVVWRGRRRKKGGLLTNIVVVFSVQNPFKVHEKTRCVCRTVRTVSRRTWAAFFWTISMQFQRKKEEKRMRLIWSCAPVFSLFYLTLNLWVGLIGPKYVNTTQNEHPVSNEAGGYLIFFSFDAQGLLGNTLRDQSFTLLKADLCQDINGGFTFSKCLNGTFPWGKCSISALVS